MANQAHYPITILRRKQVEAITGLARSTIYAHIKDGRFPKAVRLGPNSVGWLQSDIEGWIADCVQLSRASVQGVTA